MTNQQGTGAEADVGPRDAPDNLTQPFDDSATKSTVSSGQVESVEDSMLEQQIEADTAKSGQPAKQPSNVAQKLQASDQLSALKSQNNTSDHFGSSPYHSRAFDVTAAQGTHSRADHTWKDQLSNPFSLFLLCLCSLLLMCTIWLGRSKLRRKKSLR